MDVDRPPTEYSSGSEVASRADSSDENVVSPAVEADKEVAKIAEHHSTAHHVYDELCVFLGVDLVNKSTATTLRKLCAKIPRDAAKQLFESFAAEWNLVWGNLPSFAKVDESEMQRKWRVQECIIVVESFITKVAKQGDAFEFAPEIAASCLARQEEQDNAVSLLGRVKRKHAELIQTRVEKEYSDMCNAIPAFARACLGGDCRQRFLRQRYYGIVAEVLQECSDENVVSPVWEADREVTKVAPECLRGVAPGAALGGAISSH